MLDRYIRECMVPIIMAGVNSPIHWFLGCKGFRHPTRNECMGWFAQSPIIIIDSGIKEPVRGYRNFHTS